MRPELPYLAAGAVAVTGGVARERKWPADGTRAVVATVFVVILASATGSTPVAPLVRAIGLLFLMGAIIGAVPVFKANNVNTHKKKKG